MPPSAAQSQAVLQLRGLIWHSLDNGMIETALFSAERLYAYDTKNADSVHLFGLCLVRDAQYRQAEDLTKSSLKHVGCAYVYAQCCLKLVGGKEQQGVNALEACKRLWGTNTQWNNHSDTERRALPDAAAVYCLLGKLWQALGDAKKCVDAYVAAVKINPFLWEAFSGLCSTGVNLRLNNIFKQTQEMTEFCKMIVPVTSTATADEPAVRMRNGTENQNDPFASTGQNRDRSDLSYNNHPSFFNRLNEGTTTASPLETPTAQPSASASHEVMAASNGIPDKPLPMRKTRAAAADLTGRKLTSRITRDNNAETKRSVVPPPEPSAPPAPARRSTRLNTLKFASKIGTTDKEARSAKEREREVKKRAVSARIRSAATGKDKEKDKASEDINVSEDLAPSASKNDGELRAATLQASPAGVLKRKAASDTSLTRVTKKQMPDATKAPVISAPTKPQVTIDLPKQDAQIFLLEMYRKIGTGYFCLTRYNCTDALQAFGSLPMGQRETPRIQCLMGRAYYEMANYNEAEKMFLRVRQLDHVRTRDMEVFSTILWHQRKEVDLSYLAHELMELDRASPEAWCALGNCFSLQRDHDQALKCFKRATQLDAKLAYAFTLQGHEHVSNEEYEKALNAYRSAVTADNRHYNAWYGLGKVYEKMGKYEIAEKHFRTATKINPTNSVLICCVGMVLEKMKDYLGALEQYSAAVNMSPNSPLSRFKKARTLMSLRNYHEALKELTVLKDLAPDEANVHFLLGRLYKSMHNKSLAIKHLTIALNLDPKAAHLIKEVIENLDDEDDAYEAEDSEVYRLLDGDQ